MFNIIIKALFWIIGKIGDIILTPILLVVNTFLPNLNIDFNSIFGFLEQGFQYVPFFFKLLMIPAPLVQLTVIIFIALVSIIGGLRAYRFIMKIYTKFKP